jgi:hypothetical protein
VTGPPAACRYAARLGGFFVGAVTGNSRPETGPVTGFAHATTRVFMAKMAETRVIPHRLRRNPCYSCVSGRCNRETAKPRKTYTPCVCARACARVCACVCVCVYVYLISWLHGYIIIYMDVCCCFIKGFWCNRNRNRRRYAGYSSNLSNPAQRRRIPVTPPFHHCASGSVPTKIRATQQRPPARAT